MISRPQQTVAIRIDESLENENLLGTLGVSAVNIIPAHSAEMAAQTPPRSSAENARHLRHRSTGDRTRVRAAESSAPRICCPPTPAPSANAKDRESRPQDDSRWEKIQCRRCRRDW